MKYIGSYEKFSTSMKYIGGGGGGECCQIVGGIHPRPITPGFAPMLIEFPKNIDKPSNKSYPTDQKTSSILVPTVPFYVACAQGRREKIRTPGQRYDAGPLGGKI